MVTKWLHIFASAGDHPWVLPIWKAVVDAVNSGKVRPLPNKVYELGLHISTRLDILPRIVTRINSEVRQVYTAVSGYKKEHIFSKGSEGYTFKIDDDLKYSLLADIDSLLFELNSVCELMTNLFYDLYSHIGKPIKKGGAGLKIKNVIEAAGQDASWFQALVDPRNFFIHEGAPYFAIDISKGPGKDDLLIMKENLNCFNDNSKFIKLSELDLIVNGFTTAKAVIQRHLIDLYS